MAAFPTFRGRRAIRELGKVLGLPPGEIERVARKANSPRGDAERDILAAGSDRAYPDRESPDGAGEPSLGAFRDGGRPDGSGGLRALDALALACATGGRGAEEAGTGGGARVSRLRGPDCARAGGEEEDSAAEMGTNMRAVAPPVQSFASGRRR